MLRLDPSRRLHPAHRLHRWAPMGAMQVPTHRLVAAGEAEVPHQHVEHDARRTAGLGSLDHPPIAKPLQHRGDYRCPPVQRRRRPSFASRGRSNRYRSVDSSTPSLPATSRIETSRAIISRAIITCSLRNFAMVSPAVESDRRGAGFRLLRQGSAGIWVFTSAGIWGFFYNIKISRVLAFQRVWHCRLTVLAADERLAEARCARDDGTARSRSWR